MFKTLFQNPCLFKVLLSFCNKGNMQFNFECFSFSKSKVRAMETDVKMFRDTSDENTEFKC